MKVHVKFLFMILLLMLVMVVVGCGSSGGGGGTIPNPTYTVTYNGNVNTGGAVPTDSTSYEQGQTVTVLGNTGNLVKTGYTFSGWNTAADGSGTNYAASGAVTFTMGSANVVLYAKWQTLVPDTGQTTKYSTAFGDDSDYLINPPSYTDNGNGTITDNVTGLLWQKCSMGQSGTACDGATAATYTWADAGAACGNLSLAGTGWRLPTDFELMTIVDYGTYSPSINTTYFPNTIASDYWSSTTDASNTTVAWLVHFYDGSVDGYGKAGSHCVRCVR